MPSAVPAFLESSSIALASLKALKNLAHYVTPYRGPLLSFLITLSSQSPVTKRSFSNGPVIISNSPDPAFTEVNGIFYAFFTTHGAQNIPIATSLEIVTWTVTGQDPFPNLAAWCSE